MKLKSNKSYLAIEIKIENTIESKFVNVPFVYLGDF